MSTVYTAAYLASARKISFVVTYPDGAVFTGAVLAEGALAADFDLALRGVGLASLGRTLDALRENHARAYRDHRTESCAWALAPLPFHVNIEPEI